MPKRERSIERQPLPLSEDLIAAAARALSVPGKLDAYATQARARVDEAWGFAADAETEFAHRHGTD